MIKVKNLNKSYGSKLVLSNINFNIKKGELAVIYGLNGAGKTTLIKCLIGLFKNQSGQILIKPNDKTEIGLFLGHEMLIDKLKVKEYLYLVGRLKGLVENTINERILEFAKNLKFENYLDDYISKISFGTKSKTLFVASVLNNPKVLIMDEPFLGLDLVSIKEISNILLSLKNKGCTIFISSHQINIIEDIIDKILILKDSKILINKAINEINNDDKLNQFISLTDFILFKMENT